MVRPLRDYLNAIEDAWLAKSPAMFRTSLNLQTTLREYVADKQASGVAADYRQAGLAMSGSHVGFTAERRQEAAEQQWRTIDKPRERTWTPSAELNAVMNLSKQSSFEYTMSQGRLAANVNQQHHAQGHGQDRD